MLGIISAPCKTVENLIWLCSESSLIFGEFFSPSCQTYSSMHSNGGKIHQKLTKTQNKAKLSFQRFYKVR